MGFDNSDQGIVNRTQKQRSDLAKEQQALDDLKSDATRNSRIRAAIANVRNQTHLDFQKASSPSTNEVPRAEASPQPSPQPSPSPRRSPVSVALRSALERILNRKGLLGDWEEGQKILDAVGLKDMMLSKGHKKTIETAPLNQKEGSSADISTVANAKVQKNWIHLQINWKKLQIDAKNLSFADFYTNKKTSQSARLTHSEEARDIDLSDVSPAKLQKVSEKDKAQSEKIFSAAKKKFGTTSDIREAGYVLPDGTMLDFSGRHEMMPGSDSSHLNGRRATDHRAIWQIEFGYDAEGNEVDTGVKTSMPDFIERGAIRIDANAGTINLSTKPTEAQRKVLQRLIQRNGGDVSVDYGNGWDSNHYSEYEGAKANRVTADIDRYFDEGIKTDGNLKYYRTSTGEVYGFAYNGKIYIDPRIAGADTPIHEYTHLWADAMKLANPKTWQRIVGIMEKQTKLWNDIAKQYPELEDKDTLAAEVLAHYSGSKGAERLQKLIDETDTADASLYAQTVAAVHRMQKVLDTFWRAVADKIGFRFSNAQTVADTILKDLLDENHTLASPATVRRDSVAPEMQEVQKRDTFYSNAQRAVEGPFKDVTWTVSWKVKNGLKLEPKEKAALKAAGIPYEGIADIKPIGKSSQFGNIYLQFKGKVKEAFDFMMQKKDGFLKAVFHRDEVGDIGLVWGNGKAGLYHIILKHVINYDDFSSVNDVVNTIDDVIKTGQYSLQKDGRVAFIKDNYRVAIEKSEEGNWIISALDTSRKKKEKKRARCYPFTPKHLRRREWGTCISATRFFWWQR